MPVDLNNLTGPQRKIVRAAFLDAFDQGRLPIFLQDELNKKLAVLVNANASFEKVVFDLINVSQQQGWTERMVKAAEAFSANSRIATLRQTLETSAVIDLDAVDSQVKNRAPAAGGLERVTRQGGFADWGLWVARMTEIGRQICRIDYPVDLKIGGGTGFLVAPDLVLTNYHVIEKHQTGARDPAGITCRFDFAAGGVNPPVPVKLAQNWLVDRSPYSPHDPGDTGGLPSAQDLDYALLRLERPLGEEMIGGAKRGWLPLSDATPLPAPGDVVFIAQHPQLEPLKLSVGTIIKANDNATRVRYDASTEKGSSGSPCLDARLNVVALHHGGDPDYSHLLAEFNQGIPITLILKRLNVGGFMKF